ncbi:MAG: putative von willebrand factor type A domain protein [Harvfovirus sp.]|uniref:Putative von willebrand factor type A domain protein n=1 Tax=Harvfovirus sp. TaxID=2487768 RepID=A0A3G4ZZX7_9VIRU|nr:MAG: putative von willebrand factor type A domain protein [Harvfovirus sp.]
MLRAISQTFGRCVVKRTGRRTLSNHGDKWLGNYSSGSSLKAFQGKPAAGNSPLKMRLKTFDKHGSMLSIIPGEGTKRVNSDMCCVIDISGSMATEAVLKNANGVDEGYGLSMLDLVKHSVRTIIHSLSDKDRFSLIIFNSSAEILINMTQMDTMGKINALGTLEKYDAAGGTNIWAGLSSALEIVSQQGREQKSNNNLSVFMLTDGASNCGPPQGELAQLKKYIDENGLLSNVNTFGFGYGSNSKLLSEISLATNGLYSFIPDCGMVGTVFVNSIANFLVSCATNTVLHVKSKESSQNINIGPIIYGQSKDIFIPNKLIERDDFTVGLTYKSTEDGSFRMLSLGAESREEIRSDEDVLDFQRNYYRSKVAFEMNEKDGVMVESKKVLDDIIAELRGDMLKDPYIQDLRKDLVGEMSFAVSRDDWFHKWGVHYLRSISMAHLFQTCNNFKDAGVQHYGGKLFRNTRDEIDKIFCKLPPPKATGRSSSGVTVTNMQTFNNSNNPCYAGDCFVHMADKTKKMVCEIEKGDLVKTPTGYAVVKYIMKSICVKGELELVKFEGGLRITPFHPVRIGGVWVFPSENKLPMLEKCEAVYSFVLDKEHIVIIDGIETITLGNNFSKTEKIYHSYFSTDAVIADIAKMDKEQNNDGKIIITPDFVRRHRDTFVINKISSD